MGSIILIPPKPKGGKGRTRLSDMQEALMERIIKKFYLNQQKLSPARIVEEICQLPKMSSLFYQSHVHHRY